MNYRSEILIAHVADLHLDSSQLDESLGALRFVVETAISRKACALVIAGDVWDRSVSVDDRSAFNPAVDLIARAAEHMPVMGVYGNHDRPGSLQPFNAIGKLAKHLVIFADRPQTVTVGGVTFHLLPYPQKARIAGWLDGSQDDSDAAAGDILRRIAAGFAASEPDPLGAPRVLVYHGNVTGCRVESGQVMLGGDVMIGAADLEASGADYVALGHIHGQQKLGTRCWYPGSTYHCDYGETEPKYMHLVNVWRGGYMAELVRLPSRPKVTIDLALDDYEKPDFSWTQSVIEDADLKLRIRMSQEQAATLDTVPIVDSLQDYAHSHTIRIERIIIPRERVRCETITEARSLADKVRAWGESVSEDIPAGVLDKAAEMEGGVK
jgi:DNA repair protein SbcD/Mre11